MLFRQLILLLITARLAASSRTLCIVKPNAFDRRDAVIHDIVVDQGVHILIHDELMLTEEQVDELYAEHLQRPFFPELRSFMTSGPVVAMVLEHPTAISTLRYMLGPTDPSKGFLQDGSPGTLRNKYGDDLTRNGLHGSADYAAAQREISLFFPHFASFDDDAVDEEQMHATAAQAAADAGHHHHHHGHHRSHRGHHDQHDPEHDEQMIDDFLMETYMADLSDYEPGEFEGADGAASSGSEHGEL